MSFSSDKRLELTVMVMKILANTENLSNSFSMTVLLGLKSRVEREESLKIAQLSKLIHG